MEENNKSKKFMLFGLIVLVITIVVSSTYAYYVWTTSDNEVTKIVAGVGSATVTFDGGSDINASLRPVSDKSKGIVKEIKVKADTNGLTFNMYLDITSIATELKDVSFRYEFYKGTTKVKEGNFSDTYLNSNTTNCSTNSTKHITLLTSESISTSNTMYTLYIWIDGVNYVNPSTMMDKTFNFKLHADGEGAVVKNPLTAAQYITQLYTDASKTTVTNNEITYNTAESVSLMNDRLGGTTTSLDGGNIRYYGASPNNYIYFNCSDYSNQTSSTCETWRIIGIYDGKVKIIRNESIGYLAWDLDKNDDLSKTSYDNDWTTATLQKLLNESYYNGAETVTYYTGPDSTAVSLDMTSIGLKNDTTRSAISNVTWNIGGYEDSSIYVNQMYAFERGTTVYSGRPTTWTGKIALMYPSDYGYATDLSKCSENLNNYMTYTNADCTKNDWMFIGSEDGQGSEWLLTHIVEDYIVAGSVNYTGQVDYYHYGCPFTNSSLVVRPTLYLTSDLAISSGDGSSSSPYKLAV